MFAKASVGPGGKTSWSSCPHCSEEGSPGMPQTLERGILDSFAALPPPSEVVESREKLSPGCSHLEQPRSLVGALGPSLPLPMWALVPLQHS